MLRVQRLEKTFNPGTPIENRVLRGLDLDIPTGQFVTVIGGPQNTDSLNSSLMSMYEIAVSTGDVVSQIAILNIMESQNAIGRLWAMPDVDVL